MLLFLLGMPLVLYFTFVLFSLQMGEHNFSHLFLANKKQKKKALSRAFGLSRFVVYQESTDKNLAQLSDRIIVSTQSCSWFLLDDIPAGAQTTWQH